MLRAFAPLTLAALVFASAPALADSEAARRAAALSYTESPPVAEMFDQMLSPARFTAGVKEANPDLTEAQVATVARIAEQEMAASRPVFVELMVEAMVPIFTAAEIEALDRFYRTPEGASVMTKMQPFMQSYLERAAPVIHEADQRMRRRIAEALK
jgi:hypothetical protein